MRKHAFTLAGVTLLAACFPLSAAATCQLEQQKDSLQQWKTSGFVIADAEQRTLRALALVACLGSPDPELRDGIAYEALSSWMRGKQLDGALLRQLSAQLQKQLGGADPSGFRKPFTALVLSEVARTDRVQPWMTSAERAQMVEAARVYLSSVRDYRGYVDGEGWRHGVAHGADWALQLVLNKQLNAVQVQALLSAIASQAMAADGHTYGFGEPGRLARPVAYAVARGDVGEEAVDAWLAGLVTALGARPQSGDQEGWWVRRANLEAFLHALAYLADGEQTPGLVALSAGIRRTMQAMP